MKLAEFIEMDEDIKLSHFLKGVHVGEYSQDGFLYVCKQVNDFYVEVILANFKYIGMKCHRDTSKIDPYLDDIIIDIF